MTFNVVNADLLVGFLENIKLFGVTLLFAIPLGLVIAFGSMTKFAPIKMLTRGFVWVIRGTPLMLQLFVVFYAPGLLFNLHFPGENPRMTAAAVAFIINYACYFWQSDSIICTIINKLSANSISRYCTLPVCLCFK